MARSKTKMEQTARPLQQRPPRKLPSVNLLQAVLLGCGFLFISWALSILGGGSWDYWRGVAFFISLACGLILIGVAIVLQRYT